MCPGWYQSYTDDFDWTRLSGQTGSYMTGPSTGHGGYGKFVIDVMLLRRSCYCSLKSKWHCRNPVAFSYLLFFLYLLGFYIYIETSSPRLYGDRARLRFSPPSSATGKLSCLKFYYHMYGATINQLNVFNGSTIAFTKFGQQGNRWLFAEVTVFVRNTVSS